MVKRNSNRKTFHLEFLNTAQKIAWVGFENHDVLFMLGPAGTGKTHLSVAFAISELLAKRRKKIVLTRPIVDAGEKLGYLPGDLVEKVDPYMMPLYDSIDRCVGSEGLERDRVNNSLEIAPLAFLRGRTFYDAVCILDEAQNATFMQLKLFLTRLGEGSKLIICGDPGQSDLLSSEFALMDIVKRLESEKGVGIVEFKESSIVRHPLVAKIIKRLE